MLWIMLVFILLVFILVILILLAPLRLAFASIYNQDQQSAYIEANLFGIKILQREFDFEQQTEDSDETHHYIQSLKKMREHFPLYKKFAPKVRIKKFSWETSIGTGDASTSGIASGGLWSVKGIICGQITNFFNVETKPELSITPDFHKAIFDSRMHCIGKVRVGQAIRAYISTPAKKK